MVERLSLKKNFKLCPRGLEVCDLCLKPEAFEMSLKARRLSADQYAEAYPCNNCNTWNSGDR